MVGPARPSLDVEGILNDDECLELYRESLRRVAFWPRLALTAGTLAVLIGITALLGVPRFWVLTGLAIVLGMLATYTVGYVWVGPRRRCRRLTPAERTARWRINGDRLHTETGGRPVDLAWRDVDRVRVTPRLVTFELTGGRGVLALPRRSATELGEALILGWAADGGTPVSRPSS